MIEFNQTNRSGGGSPIVLNVETIQTFEPAEAEYTTTIVLKNGRTLLASVPYSEVRRIVLEARSQFVTVL
jgi:hypothetical protein